jgi:Tfp pilus assembly protein PilF
VRSSPPFSAPFSARLPALAAAIALAAVLAGCAAPSPKPVGIADLTERPAERTLLGAMRSYDDADYPAVERQADEALRLGLQSPRDVAIAHKLRAFVYCTSNRLTACEAEFRAARKADPNFALSKAEAGHPVWGPVYQKSRQ